MTITQSTIKVSYILAVIGPVSLMLKIITYGVQTEMQAVADF
jgi:hypothetical protein